MPGRHPHFLLFAVASAACVVAACGSGDATADDETAGPTVTTPSSDGPAVTARGVSFTPETVEVRAGETVTWRFADRSLPHNVVGEGFKSPLKKSGTFSHTFATAGTYEYRCTVHPGMKGSVEVS